MLQYNVINYILCPYAHICYNMLQCNITFNYYNMLQYIYIIIVLIWIVIICYNICFSFNQIPLLIHQTSLHMSLHEKERNKKMPIYTKIQSHSCHNPIPTSLFCFDMLFVCLFVCYECIRQSKQHNILTSQRWRCGCGRVKGQEWSRRRGKPKTRCIRACTYILINM